jgi:hypothetical protein
MALTPPLNFLPTFPGWTTGFELQWRQEQSVQASGRVLVKDLGAPLWTLKAITKQLSPNLLDQWRARLTALENGNVQFVAYPMSRCFPQKYPNGSWPTGGAFSGSGVLASIAGDRKTITLSGLPNGFAITIGDYLSVGNDLHQAMESATAAAGTSTAFEVRPHIWPTVSPGGAVLLQQPHCLMAMVPGSLASDAGLDGRGSVAFAAIEARL